MFSEQSGPQSQPVTMEARTFWLLVVAVLALGSSSSTGQYVGLSANQCAVPAKDRVDCGYPEVTPEQCNNRGCCFDSSIHGVPWCFKPLQEAGEPDRTHKVFQAPGSHTHLGPGWAPYATSVCWARRGFPGGTSGKEPTCSCKRHKRRGFSPRVGKIPWRRAGQPTPVCSPGESHGQRSLAGCSPGDHESDTTDHSCT
uniref:Trefoil factor 3 n=1 Tax=Bos indicus x Bos taurus TaxID=30522 RepID=A0A4W2DM58_BOBOX